MKDRPNANHCVEYSCSVSANQDRDLRAKLLLWAQIADEPAFHQLRTKEQLGYIVFRGVAENNGWMGYRILIQSERCPKYLEERIDQFLLDASKLLEGMSEHEFETHKESVQNRRREKSKNLSEEIDRLWSHICSESFDFALGKSTHT